MDDSTTDSLTTGQQTHIELNDMTYLEVWEAIRAGAFRGEQGTH